MSFTLNYPGSKINEILDKADKTLKWYQHHITFTFKDDNSWEIDYFDTDSTQCTSLDNFVTVRNHQNYIFGQCHNYKDEWMIAYDPGLARLFAYCTFIEDNSLKSEYVVLDASTWADKVTEL